MKQDWNLISIYVCDHQQTADVSAVDRSLIFTTASYDKIFPNDFKKIKQKQTKNCFLSVIAM